MKSFLFLLITLTVLNSQDFTGEFDFSSCSNSANSQIYTITNSSNTSLEYQVSSTYDEIVPTQWLQQNYSGTSFSNLVSSQYSWGFPGNFGYGAPSGCPSDYFSVRFSGQVYFPETGTYTFHSNCMDDQETIYIDGNYAFSLTWSGDTDYYYITEGWHSVQVDYVEYGGTACMTFLCELPSGGGWWPGFSPGTIETSSYPWVVLEQTSVTVAPGESADIVVNVNGEGFSNESYNGSFYITSSESGSNTLEIPIIMNVLDGDADGDGSCDSDDEYPNCADNYYDCNNECGGPAEIDNFGLCGNENSLQGAIDAAEEGSVLDVPAGEYTGPFDIDKSLTLNGESQESVFIQNADISSDVIRICYYSGDECDVTIQNVTIRNGRYGIYSKSTGSIKLFSNTFYHNGYDGHEPPDPDSQTAQDNYSDFWDSSHTSNGGAMRIRNSNGSEIAFNTVYDNLRGIRFQDSHDGHIHSNVSYNNFESGIFLAAGSYDGDSGCTNTLVEDNELYGNRNNGVLSIGGIDNTIRNNNIYDNWNSGVQLWHVANHVIEGNTISGNNFRSFNGVGYNGDARGGVSLDGSNSNNESGTFGFELTNNDISDNGREGTFTGVYVDEGVTLSNTVSGNTFQNQSPDISYGSTTTATGNICSSGCDCNSGSEGDLDGDGICGDQEVVGCQDDTACNYNEFATDAGDCIYPDGICDTCSGETDGTGTIVDNDLDDDGFCGDEVVGCQDATACNYMEFVTDAGDCIYPDGVCETCSGESDGSGTIVDNDADDDTVCDADDICAGYDDNIDSDGDGIPDGCDICPLAPGDDSDGDYVCDNADICPGFDDLADSDGDSVPDGCDEYPDCSGILDECGVCNGDNTSCIDECGIVNGPGAIYECGCEGLAELEDSINGCDIPENTITILEDGSVLYNSTDAIGSFSFNIEGATATLNSGGAAEDAGLALFESGGSFFAGFNFYDSTIPAGCGILINLVLEGEVAGVPILAFQDHEGFNLDFEYYPVPQVEACDCDGNIEDCSGQCGGDAETDECGICDGYNNEMDCNGVCFGESANDIHGNCCLESDFDECGECFGNDYDMCDYNGDGLNNLEQWGYGAHTVTGSDILDDQGGRIHLQFNRSFYDTEPISRSEVYTIERKDGDIWMVVQSFGAYGAEQYNVEASTLYNNTPTEFRIIANMDEGNFETIESIEAISIDNINPTTPENLNGSHNDNDILLTWDYEHDIDFNYHEINNIYNETIYSIENQVSLLQEDFYNEHTVQSVDINENRSNSSNHTSTYSLHSGNNFIGLSVLPDNQSVTSALESLGENANDIISEGEAATQITPGVWVGSLSSTNHVSGYWLNIDLDDKLIISGERVECEELDYNLHSGNNLISFCCKAPIPVNNIPMGCTSIIGEGVASTYFNNNWIGNLNELEPGKGYWLNCSQETQFNWDCEE